jgi:hypothetical protein
VIIAEPLKSEDVAEQFASLKEAMVYVVVEPGLTDKVIVGAVPLNGIPPGLMVPLIVPLPVTANERFVEAPLQIEAAPDIAPVGLLLTVNVEALVAVLLGVVTLTVPVDALPGSVAVICVLLLTVKSADVPLNETFVAPVKFCPLMTTLELLPAQADVVPRLVIEVTAATEPVKIKSLILYCVLAAAMLYP